MKYLLPSLGALLLLAACAGEDSLDTEDPTFSFFTLSPADLPVGYADSAYSQQLVAGGKLAEAAQQPLEWLVSAGALPAGMTLDTSTTTVSYLQGLPTIAGSYSFTIRVRSQFGTADVEFPRVLTIAPAGNLVITTGSLPNGATGAAYAQNVNASGGSGVGYTWSVYSGALPPGLSLNDHHGTLTWGAFNATGQLDQSLGGGMLAEVSGICASVRNPGVFWVHDDSGASAELYAISNTGAVLQRYSLGFTPQDWEDIAIGPGPNAGVEYLYIGDVGDNSSARTNCRLVRVEEPIVPASPVAPITLAYENFYFLYPGGPQNCETLLIDWQSGTPYLVEKTGAAPRVHKFPLPLSSSWTAGSPVTLTQVAATGSFASTLTGGDASRDGNRVILRGYGGGTEYARPAGSSFDAIFNGAGSSVAMPGGQQYEAVCYSADGTQLFTTTEIASASSAPIQMASAAADSGSTTITGTPTTPGVYTFIIQVRDSAGNTALRALTITIS